ncbi:MAG: acyltransferase [Rhizobiales bacterium]|nr:acyltransferase [Hyphomicrobiales bacterium]MBI3674750.1 acyltransferase [Hyphomicrobiales bacterium]
MPELTKMQMPGPASERLGGRPPPVEPDVSRSGKRLDIQILRGIAVSLVVLDHANLGPFGNGFLGVDMFFVISGFLITGIIARELDGGHFSFASFYLRRAKRILPAALTTIGVTALAAGWLINSLELADLRQQIVGALTFTTNAVLWTQTGYFDLEAGSKPLLHMWSLAVEEQFYLLFPLILVGLGSRFRLPGIAAILVLSFGLCLYYLAYDPNFAFYMLPTRAWQLSIGALGALVEERVPRRIFRYLVPFAAGIIALLPIWSTGYPHPGLDALLVSLATLAIILARIESRLVARLGRPVAWLGDISYSLYLVHWPVIVFLASAYVGDVPVWLRGVAVVICLILATIMYLTVERRFIRVNSRPWRFAGAAAAVSIVVGSAPFVAAAAAPTGTDFAELRRPNVGFDRACDQPVFAPRAICGTAGDTRVLVWGDSYAMHLVPGLAKRIGKMGQATFSSCLPFLDRAPLRSDIADPEGWARKCIAFNQAVLRYIAEEPSIETVILAGSYASWAKDKTRIWRMRNGQFEQGGSGIEVTHEALLETITRLEALGKKVVLFAPTPAVGTENVGCAERRLTGKFLIGPNTHCVLKTRLHEAYARETTAVLARLAAESGVKIVDPANAICFDSVCHTIIDNVLIYRDSGHLSYLGSEKVAERLKLDFLVK